VVYRPAAPASYFDLTYFPKDASGNIIGPEQEAATRPRNTAGVGLPQYAADLFQDDFSPPQVSGDTDTFSYGGVFHVTPWMSVFANYAETWSPPAANLTIYGESFGPNVSDGWDAGVRFSMLEEKLSVSLIRYEGRQENLSISTGSIGQNINNIVDTNVLNDLSLTGQNARGLAYVPRTYQDTVARKTDGYEFEAVANLARGWRLLGNFASANASQGDNLADTRSYMAANQDTMKLILSDAGVTVGADNVATVNPGVTTANSPDSATARDSWNSLAQTMQNTTIEYQKVARLAETTGNIFTDYTIQSGAFKDLRLGIGLNYRGKEVIGFRGSDTIRNPSNPNAAIDDPDVDAFTPVYRPSYDLTTVMFGYTRRVSDLLLRFDLRIENVFGEDVPLYYTTTMRPPGGDLSNPARVATPSLFYYITPRNVMFTMTVGF
jgi:hypothetical protein